MFRHSRIALVLALLMSLVLAIPVFAGGWAVITLDELPTDVVAGEPLTIGFTVLQHGKTPMTDLSPIIVANLHKDTEFKIIAEEEGKPGHYTATLTFPREGEWSWSIQAFTMDQKMPMLTVAAPALAAANPPVVTEETAASFASPMILVSAAVLALGLAGAMVGYRRKSRPVLALTALCLLAGVILLIAGAGATSEVEAQAKSEAVMDNAEGEAPLSQVEYGRQLFIAKGCITCHVNTRAASRSEYWTIEMGATNLSNFSASPEILFIRLKDPSAAKSDTQMPNLELKKEEIEALVAFINSK
ncbi:MAG TPA: cytochrome c [Anaerolineales bacterium]|nr:cytochrome c [Anaerolineales bacterium]